MKKDKFDHEHEPPVKVRIGFWLLDSKDYLFKHVLLFTFGLMLTACFIVARIVYIFEKDVQGSNITSYWDGVWWAIVTALTVGYGDKYPVSLEGRLFGILLMFIGVLLMGVITAKISSMFLERALLDRRGFVDERLLHKHLVICGWKKEMYELINHVMESNQNLPPEKIVLVNSVHDEELNALMASPKMSKIKIVKGDFFTRPVLERAAPNRARKIIILADSTPSPTGQVPTVTEADARTIMTAMTLSNIAKGVPVVAEILDATMDQYLKLAHVNEIVYSRDYSRLIIAKASTSTGIPNIFQNLLATDSQFKLSTQPIPEEFMFKPFKNLKAKFEEDYPGSVLLGLLENSGNTHSIKEQALKKAQKTPDIKKLVENLQNIKTLKFNNPIFAPGPEYQVLEGSLAIVIEKRSAKEVKHAVAA